MVTVAERLKEETLASYFHQSFIMWKYQAYRHSQTLLHENIVYSEQWSNLIVNSLACSKSEFLNILKVPFITHLLTPLEQKSVYNSINSKSLKLLQILILETVYLKLTKIWSKWSINSGFKAFWSGLPYNYKALRSCQIPKTLGQILPWWTNQMYWKLAKI